MSRDGGRLAFGRILLKLSGEALMGEGNFGIDAATVDYVAQEIARVRSCGIELALVIGAGNIFRGMAGAAAGMDRSTADNMGMLATVLNCLAMADGLRRRQVEARVLSAIAMGNVCEPYSREAAVRHLTAGRVVIFAAGTGNPYFTTDTAAVLRGLEIGADVVMKATRVDGVYDKDPERHPDAVRYDRLDYDEALARRLGVMDATAISLARDNGLPIYVFDMTVSGNIERAAAGDRIGTLVGPDPGRRRRGGGEQ